MVKYAFIQIYENGNWFSCLHVMGNYGTISHMGQEIRDIKYDAVWYFPRGRGGGGVLYCKPRNFKAHFLSLALRQAIKLAKVKANMIIILCLGNLIDSLITALSDSQLILLYFLGYKTGVFPKNLDLSQKTDLETFGIVLEGKNLYYSKIS